MIALDGKLLAVIPFKVFNTGTGEKLRIDNPSSTIAEKNNVI